MLHNRILTARRARHSAVNIHTPIDTANCVSLFMERARDLLVRHRRAGVDGAGRGDEPTRVGAEVGSRAFTVRVHVKVSAGGRRPKVGAGTRGRYVRRSGYRRVKSKGAEGE